jgi:hypothetical protein
VLPSPTMQLFEGLLTVLLNELWRKTTEDDETYYCWGLSNELLGPGTYKIPNIFRSVSYQEPYDSQKVAIRLAPSLLMEWDK